MTGLELLNRVRRDAQQLAAHPEMPQLPIADQVPNVALAYAPTNGERSWREYSSLGLDRGGSPSALQKQTLLFRQETRALPLVALEGGFHMFKFISLLAHTIAFLGELWLKRTQEINK